MNQEAIPFKKKIETLTFESICDGEAIAEANRELAALQADLHNTKKKAKGKRELTIKIVIETDDIRDVVGIEFHIQKKLAPWQPEDNTRWFDDEIPEAERDKRGF